MSAPPRQAVFLSYASQDAEPARRICEALRAAGVEVWFDQSELRGGDVWDQKIRRQIKDCALFVPVISANTNARPEGYFRLEWHLAEQRTYLMAHDQSFLMPVVVDDTSDAEARVPERFHERQWTRLRGGVASSQFCDQVRALLACEVEPRARRSGAKSGEPKPAGRARQRVQPRVLAAGGAAVVAAAALAFWRPWKPAPPATTAPLNPAPAEEQRVTLSETKRLLRQAEEILRKTEFGMSEVDMATRLCDRAVALDPADAEAWAFASVVDTWAVYFMGDGSTERRESARAKAARAMNLAPTRFEARRAQAIYLAYIANAAHQAQQLLSELWQERPGDYQTALGLGFTLRNLRRREEAIALYDELARDPNLTAKVLNEKSWTLYNMGRIPEADRALDQSIAAQPFTGNVSLKVLVALWWYGDVNLALDAWNRLPAEVRLEDRALAAGILLFHWRREPERLLALLKTVPRDWVSWKFHGPIAAATGEAHEMANRPAAARNDWRTALAVVDRRIGQNPANGELVMWRAYLQAALGQHDGAAESLKLARELGGAFRSRWMDLSGRLRTPDEILTGLEPWLGVLRLNPAYDSVRQHPRFQALLARAEADPRFSPNAAERVESQKSNVGAQKSKDGNQTSVVQPPLKD